MMSEVVKSFYNVNVNCEEERFSNPYSRIEFETTIYNIEKYFPVAGRILDIGCGTGRYSIELLSRGYNVTLYDISKEELNLAKSNIQKQKLVANNYICGDCSDLSQFEDNSFDGILLMGPMYHISNKDFRETILKESRRILKDDGVALVAYINSWGVMKSTLTEHSYRLRNIQTMKDLLIDNSFSEKESFTKVYLSTPPIAKKEIEVSGFNIISYFGAESFVAGLINEVAKISLEEEDYKNLIELAKVTCEMEQYREATEHIHFIVS